MGKMKHMKGSRGTLWSGRCRRLAAFALSLVLGLSVVGCGSSGDREGGKSDGAQEAASVSLGIDGYVYQAKPVNIDLGGGNLNDSVISGNYLYYSVYTWNEETYESHEDYWRVNLVEGGEAEPLNVDYSEHGESLSMMRFLPDAEGNLIFFFMDYSQQITNADGMSISPTFMAKYDGQGNELFWKELTEVFKDESYAYVQGAATDPENHLYVNMDSGIYLFDENGEAAGKIDAANYISSLGTGKDGRVYCMMYGENGYELFPVDYTGKKLGDSYKNVPSVNGDCLVPGIDGDFMMYDSDNVYEYDCATQTHKTILKWLDSDLYGNRIRFTAPLEDGRLAVVTYSYGDDDSGMYLLTKTAVSEMPERELITLGTFSTGSDLQEMAVQFNKQNDKYRIAIKSYYDYNSITSDNYQEVYDSAVTAMNNEMTSGNGPDIYSLSSYYVNIANLVRKGALEDLTPYLDASDKVSREDFVETVIDAFTYDGVLVCIPTYFTVQTVAGPKSLVGEDMGWTLDEMMAVLDANPDIKPFDNMIQSDMLDMCLAFNQEMFIDYETGECHFDSDDFKKVLEFVNRFPAEYEEYDGQSTGKKIQDGKVLLYEVNLYQADAITDAEQIYGEGNVTYIGYPTMDGSVGCMLQPSGDSLAIASKSSNKEGAWSFIEYVLESAYGSNRWGFGFESNKEALESGLSEDSRNPYETDENGDIILDENGKPARQSFGWSESEDGFRLYSYVPLPEEIETVRELISLARPVSTSGLDDDVMDIILEEAEPYFQGQKSVDEVAGIIQSRVKIYISENS